MQGIGTQYTCLKYFDTKGDVCNVDSSCKMDPQPIEIHLKDNRCVDLFIANNPWRAYTKGANSMVFQFCILCKEKRFEDKSFNGSEVEFSRLLNGNVRYTCQKDECLSEKWPDVADNMSQEKYDAIFSLDKVHQLKNVVKEEARATELRYFKA